VTIQVDPAQLDGYAVQLERNSGHFITPLRSYCAAHCTRTDGMTGLLAPAKPMVSLAHEATSALFTSGERNLFQVASNLRAAAATYRAGDVVAAERIWLTKPRRPAPEGYRGRDHVGHPGDFRDPFTPQPAAPVERHEFTRYIAEVRQQIGEIDDLLVRYARFSLAEQVFPWIAGDWDTLRENAEAYAALAGMDGVQAISVNIAYGMDSLSASWDSPAATQFAFQIRERWLPALETLQHFLQVHEEAFEHLAQQAEIMFHTLVLLLEVLKFWVIEKVLRLTRIIGSVLGGGRVWDEVMELITGVLKVWHQIKMLFEVLRLMIDGAFQAVQAAGALATAIEETWLAPENRLDPVRVGVVTAA